MAFVTEHASAEDQEKYGLIELREKYHLANPNYEWIVDRERNIFVMCGGIARGLPMFHFVLSKRGETSRFSMILDTFPETRTIKWTLVRLRAPRYKSDQERREAEEYCSMLRDALISYKAMGMTPTKANSYENIIFDI